jgi:hypothetical protein
MVTFWDFKGSEDFMRYPSKIKKMMGFNRNEWESWE